MHIAPGAFFTSPGRIGRACLFGEARACRKSRLPLVTSEASLPGRRAARYMLSIITSQSGAEPKRLGRWPRSWPRSVDHARSHGLHGTVVFEAREAWLDGVAHSGQIIAHVDANR